MHPSLEWEYSRYSLTPSRALNSALKLAELIDGTCLKQRLKKGMFHMHLMHCMVAFLPFYVLRRSSAYVEV